MKAHLIAVLALAPLAALCQPVSSTYATRDGRAATVVIACPTSDGTFTAASCALAKSPAVTFTASSTSAITTGNVAVTVFPSGSVANGCDIVNTGTAILYLDFISTAAAGSATSLPLQSGQSYHCAFAPLNAVTAIAGQPQPFVAVRY